MSLALRYDVVIRRGHRCLRAWLKITSPIIEGLDDGKEGKNIYFYFPISCAVFVLLYIASACLFIFFDLKYDFSQRFCSVPPGNRRPFNFGNMFGTYIFSCRWQTVTPYCVFLFNLHSKFLCEKHTHFFPWHWRK